MSLLTSAVAAVIRDDAGHVLLCQQSGGHHMWGLPGGKIRTGESPAHAAVRDIREETGNDVELRDLVGLYRLTGDACGELPDVLVHVFRAQIPPGDIAAVNAPGRISRLAWHDPAALPAPLTATARAAIADACAGRSGVVADVRRDAGPDAMRDSAPDVEAADRAPDLAMVATAALSS